MSVSSSGITEMELDTANGDWPITKTTVYNDQAEIRRSLSYRPAMSGAVMLKLQGLPDTFNAASVRADIPTKNARLIEVNQGTSWKSGKADEKINDRLKELGYDLQKLEKQQERLNFRQAKVTEHQSSILKAMSSSSFEKKQCPIEPELFPQIQRALKFYDDLKIKFEGDSEVLQNQLSDVRKEIGDLNEKQGKNTQGKWVREASVMIYIPEELMKVKGAGQTVDIQLFYMVNGASYKASYDISVEKGSDKAALSYFGEVVNSTKEDWTEVELCLSTAKPSIGGALPPLPRKQVDFKLPASHFLMNQQNNWDLNNGLEMMKSTLDQRRTSMAAPPQMLANMDFFGAPAPGGGGPMAEIPEQRIDVSAVASGDTGSTLFNIQRLANIDSDNKPHRQTIALVDLQALFTHAASPKVSKNVYLKCSTKNTSAYPFLPGQMGVFIDGSFISNSRMELVRPNEDFGMYLGIDDSVRLSYGPEVVKKKTVGGGGMMRSSKRWHKTILREISITNNTPNKINICVYEQLPLSKDGKIKVELVKPDVKKADGVKYLINSFNNLEARTELESGKKFNMPFEYTVEWPEGEEMTIVQTRREH